MTMNTAEPNTTSEGVFPHPARYGLKLAAAAADPGTDPCDLCEAALPGYVLDELVESDRDWIAEHTKHCNYCRNELNSFEALDDLLDLCEVECDFESKCVKASWSRINTPIGELTVAVSPKGVCEIGFGWIDDDASFVERLVGRGYVPVRDDVAVLPVAHELADYFSGLRKTFDLPVDLGGVSDFSRAVLGATLAVPFGQTQTYADIARAIGKPRASRAVGNALNRNPVPLLVPCHRIVPASGGIGNYAVDPTVKERLLSLEGAIPPPAPAFA